MPNWVSNHLFIDATEDRLQEVLESIRVDGKPLGTIDFNKVIPMPESLNLTKGSVTDKSIDAFLSHLRNELVLHPDRPGLPEEIKRYVSAGIQYKSGEFGGFSRPALMSAEEIDAEAKSHRMEIAEFLELGKKYLDNQLNYGAVTWWEWSVENWGTKWPAEQGDIQDIEDQRHLEFNTAWSAPLPIIKALSEKFLDISFSIKWADEDIGNNLGRMFFQGGKVVDEYIPESGSKEAYEFYFELEDTQPEDHYLKYDPAIDNYVFDEELEQRAMDLYRAQQANRALEGKVRDAAARSGELASGDKGIHQEPSR